MKKISISLKCCYGVNVLDTVLDFSIKRTYAIYAPNGIMKTSFAKTFKDLSNGIDSRDLVFPERKTERIIKDENGNDIAPNEVFVVEPYNDQFNSDKLSTLLVTKKLKDEYEEVYQELEKEKKDFITKLKAVSQSTDCEAEFASTFSKSDKDNFFELLLEVSKQLDGKQKKYSFRYNDIFDKKGNVEKFLSKHKDSLDLYVQNYESLISKSNFFKKSKNTFGTYQAGEILKSISDNSFFEAGHAIELTDKTVIDSAEKFKNLLEGEIKKVVNDEKLKKVFDTVDKAIGSNIELRAFKTVIENDNLLLLELKNYEEFKKKVWLGYLDELKREVDLLISFYSSRKEHLEAIVRKAKEEETDWERSINEFNKRFKGLPFRLSLQNKEDVILRTSTPTVEFIFKDSQEEKFIGRDILLTVLSQGERRALYLLNIIFEVQARRKSNQKTLFIIDDIADSFDYKNKYAIIEYLVDISKESCFYQILLTHNFDFFRTVEARFVDRTHCRMVVKSKDKLELVDAAYLKPFKHFKDNLHIDNKILIATIPFIRNLAEYSGYDQEYKSLCSMLHIKTDTDTITVKDLESIIKTILKDKNTLTLSDPMKYVKVLIFEQADQILNTTDGVISLENKIVLSIAIRLKAEIFMIKKISDPNFVNGVLKNQTVELINKYKELFSTNFPQIELLEQVNLMTPENIHINSFMYEPILDMSDEHLKDLYANISKL